MASFFFLFSWQCPPLFCLLTNLPFTYIFLCVYTLYWICGTKISKYQCSADTECSELGYKHTDHIFNLDSSYKSHCYICFWGHWVAKLIMHVFPIVSGTALPWIKSPSNHEFRAISGGKKHDIYSVCVLSPNFIFVRGLVKFVPAVARLVCPTHERWTQYWSCYRSQQSAPYLVVLT